MPSPTRFRPAMQWIDTFRRSAFRREIAIALLIKFVLLGLLWAAFFAQTKPIVDAWTLQSVILGQTPAVSEDKKPAGNIHAPD